MGCLSSKSKVAAGKNDSSTAVVPVPAPAPADATEQEAAAPAEAATAATETAPAAAAKEEEEEEAVATETAPAAVVAPTEADSPADVSDDKWKDEKLRRWSISWQFTAGPFDVDETIHGPIKLHWDNKVVSVGTTDDCQLKIDGDSEIQPEHGMISFKEDQLLYVNSSEAPTKLDNVDVDSEAGPINLKNGAVLSIGTTKLVITCYTEFAAAF